MALFDIVAAGPESFALVCDVDDDASRLFASVGFDIGWPPDHPFVVSERARFRTAAERGLVRIARDPAGVCLGVAVLGTLDGAPYLEQLSVRLAAMRQGTGAALLAVSKAWARDLCGPLWLTTYAHVPFNGPYYLRHGFHAVPTDEHGPELRAVLAEQRRYLPAPERRVAMRAVLA